MFGRAPLSSSALSGNFALLGALVESGALADIPGAQRDAFATHVEAGVLADTADSQTAYQAIGYESLEGRDVPVAVAALNVEIGRAHV